MMDIGKSGRGKIPPVDCSSPHHQYPGSGVYPARGFSSSKSRKSHILAFGGFLLIKFHTYKHQELKSFLV